MEQLISSPVVKSFLAGSFSGTCSTLLFQPLDLVKTRIQSSVSIGNGPDGMIKIFNTVVRNEKLIGLWKGVVPSITRCVPGVGIYFSSLHWLRTNVGSSNPHPLESVCLGATARTFAVISVLPFTVLKTRYESGLFKYGNMAQALVFVYKQEGVKGLYSGFGATVLRDVPFSGIYLMFYTQIKKNIPQNLQSLILQTCGYSFAIMIFCILPPHINQANPDCVTDRVLSFSDNEDDLSETYLPLMHFSCGLMAGALASMLTQPADVVKTHVQLYPKKYGRLVTVMMFIYERDGILGFWRGIVPRTLRRTLMAAMAWTIYEQVMRNAGLATTGGK